jgi:hypothetical protein
MLRGVSEFPKERRAEMSQTQEAGAAVKAKRLSLDTWAVLLALVLAALVRAGVFKHVPW